MSEVIKEVLSLTIEEALNDGGFWFDGNYLWFRQARLGKINIDLRGGVRE